MSTSFQILIAKAFNKDVGDMDTLFSETSNVYEIEQSTVQLEGDAK